MASLSHILAPAEPEAPPEPAPAPAPAPAPSPPKRPPSPAARPPQDMSAAPSPNATAEDTATSAQQPNSSSKSKGKDAASVYGGNKLRHLKKEDGIPLWRKDIQFDFLRLVFEDKTKCFTKYSDKTTGHTFAEVYIDAMAKSSKCSKILKEKLLQEEEGREGVPGGAISMAMVCLLVNVGRMNTTLNFFPEMRAQLRTYHSIPALQAHQDPNAYKQLQDAPRLKSILKGATEDSPQPGTIEEIKAASVPRTNPVNLVFVMSQFAPKITEAHFSPPREFHDLVMRSSLSSASRARAFLWLCWWYLESDFSVEASKTNPFGPGQYAEGDEGGLLINVPTLESLTEEQAALENVDTEEEELYGEIKRKERIAILASDPSPAMVALKRARKEKGLATYSDDEHMADVPHGIRKPALETASERTRSPSPAASGVGFQAVNASAKSAITSDMRINTLLNNDGASTGPSPTDIVPSSLPTIAPKKGPGPGRGNWRRKKTQDAHAHRAGGDGAISSHHVPLLPANSQSAYGFVAETPGSQAARPATPGSGAGYGQNTYLASSAAGSPTRSAALTYTANNVGDNSRANPDHVPTPSFQAQKRSRGVTQHQTAIMNHRRQQIAYTLDRRMRRYHNRQEVKREEEGPLWRAWKRLKLMPPDYDSEEELIKIRKVRDKDEDWRTAHRNAKDSGASHAVDFDVDLETMRSRKVLFAGFSCVETERSDAGEEARAMMKTLQRAERRLARWQDERTPPGMAVIRRRHLAAQGLLAAPRRRLPVRTLSMDQDGLEIVESRAPQRRSGLLRRNGSTRSRRSVATMERNASAAHDQANMDDEDEGAGELDEEDRELLGEVDADESSSDEGSEDD